jgi:hypothetical protein
MRKQTFKLVAALLAIIGIAFIGCQPEPEQDNGKNNPPTPSEHVHQWGDWAETTPATCTAAGEETRVCSLDPTHKETRVGAALGHDWEWVVTTPATYTAAGTETKTCKHDPSYTDGTRPIPQLSYTSTSIVELGTWLASQPANTADTAYKIVLNVNDISNIRTTLNAAPDKYIFLDLSGSTITIIPDRLFMGNGSPLGCTTLVGIILPNTVTSIEEYAFMGCRNLISITIPDSVTSINEFAFISCNNLTSITIPKSVTSIGRAAFSSASLTEINIDADNSAYTSENSILYNKEKTVLHTYLAGKAETTLIIPNTVTSIEEFAFYNCTNLTSVTIGNSVSIGFTAFYNCTNLTSVTFQGPIPSTEFNNFAFRLGDLRAKFYATNASNGTPGTYTTTAPVGDSSAWTKQPN